MSLLPLFRAQVASRPAAPALQWREAQWSYADLERALRAVAGGLRGCGLNAGDRVALLARNSPQYVAAFYGTMASGGVAVALNSQERAEVLVRQIVHSGARVLIADGGHEEVSAVRAAAESNGVRCLTVDVIDDANAHQRFLAQWANSDSSELEPADPPAQAAAMLIYTSGTTGRPKAVTLSHGNLAANARAIVEYLSITADDRGFCVLPFYFSYGNSVLTSHLSCGASVILEDNLAYPHRTLERMAATRATGFAGVPSTFALLLGRCRFGEHDLGALRYVTQAGGAMARPTIAQLSKELPRVELYVMYGQTEATARITYLPPRRLAEKIGSVGIPVADTEIEIFDAERGVLPANETGEVRVRGPGVMLGYWEDPGATQETIRDGWLCTGDLGHLDSDGFLYIDGRAVEMIKVGAFRVSPYEVEEVIGLLAGVQEVAVTGTPDAVLGQAVKAVIVPRSDASPDALSVKAHCRQRLAAYKVPKIVEFVSSLPRTASGKVRRLELA